jgi:hypothetical protein
MNIHRRPYFVLSFAVVLLGLGLYAYTNPGVAACALTSHDQKYPVIFEQLLAESRIRIKNKFGTPQAGPIMVFFNDSNAFWPLKLNEFGSSHFIGTKICIMIGSKGQSPDVVAHELMHAEIAERVGYIRRLTQLPMWFDEGLAMQVDYRPQYNLTNSSGVESAIIKSLWSAKEFFVHDDDLLTQHYARAKAVVAHWVAKVGNKSVFLQLERIRDGESFDAVINDN